MAKAPTGFRVRKKVDGKIVAIKAKDGQRLSAKSGKTKLHDLKSKAWKKTYQKLLKEEHEANPTPEAMSRRDWQKLHKLPRPFKAKGGPAYTSLSRRWWDGFSRERQINFRKLYPEPSLRKLFPLNSNRRRRK